MPLFVSYYPPPPRSSRRGRETFQKTFLENSGVFLWRLTLRITSSTRVALDYSLLAELSEARNWIDPRARPRGSFALAVDVGMPLLRSAGKIIPFFNLELQTERVTINGETLDGAAQRNRVTGVINRICGFNSGAQ